jgi:hypothetical protein
MNLGLKIAPIDEAKAVKRRGALDRVHKAEMGSQMKRELREAKSSGDVEKIMKRYESLRIRQVER